MKWLSQSENEDGKVKDLEEHLSQVVGVLVEDFAGQDFISNNAGGGPDYWQKESEKVGTFENRWNGFLVETEYSSRRDRKEPVNWGMNLCDLRTSSGKARLRREEAKGGRKEKI